MKSYKTEIKFWLILDLLDQALNNSAQNYYEGGE